MVSPQLRVWLCKSRGQFHVVFEKISSTVIEIILNTDVLGEEEKENT